MKPILQSTMFSRNIYGSTLLPAVYVVCFASGAGVGAAYIHCAAILCTDLWQRRIEEEKRERNERFPGAHALQERERERERESAALSVCFVQHEEECACVCVCVCVQ